MNSDDANKTILTLVHRVRSPAGDDALFANAESIEANSHAFLAAIHKGMAELHMEAVVNIIDIQERLLKIDQASEEARTLSIDLLPWYHVNNELAWTGLQRKRHIVRRMCGFKPRPRLAKSNPEGVFSVIEEINSDPLKFAMWADATSFIDVSDILVIDPLSGSHTLLEVKQQDESVWAFPSSVPKESLREFQLHITGPANKAEAKTQRLRRQLKRMTQIEKIIATDTGIDPFLNQPVLIAESNTEERYFHEDLAVLMARARLHGHAFDLIDNCLWIGVYYDQDPRQQLGFAVSAAGVFSDGSEHGFQAMIHCALAEARTYSQVASHWLALPVFSFDLSDEDVFHLVSGIANVRMYLHWDLWAQFLECFGGSFRWLSDKEYRSTTEYQLYKTPDRYTNGIPYVTFGDTSFVPSSTQMIRIFTDMKRPSMLAELAFKQSQILE
ncbi:MAG: hypothetical protein KF812_01480 [Fimbriimonadaceae bacterium]|nr:hypothetical protein [Fimbriimonadaceae bacterium]